MPKGLENAGFLRSRADQLADYLRGCIVRGELKEPLPSARNWSAQLGVGHSTLEAALKVLEREGRLRVLPRQGVRLLATEDVKEASPHRRVVRLLYVGVDCTDITHSAELFQVLFARLGAQGIHFSIESCDLPRARKIHERGERKDELLVRVAAKDGDLKTLQTVGQDRQASYHARAGAFSELAQIAERQGTPSLAATHYLQALENCVVLPAYGSLEDQIWREVRDRLGKEITTDAYAASLNTLGLRTKDQQLLEQITFELGKLKILEIKPRRPGG